MNIFLALNGDALIVDAEPIYQGSNAVTDICVQSYMPSDTAMELYFEMPDEAHTVVGPFVMSLSSPSQNDLHYWKWTLIESVTALAGTVKVTVNAISGAPSDPITGTQNTTSYRCAFEVLKGVLPSPPAFPPAQDQWELILQYMQGAFTAADEAADSAKKAESSAAEAVKSSNVAVETAKEASDTANSAKNIASAASAKAQQAFVSASSANVTADNALTAAVQSLQTANDIYYTINHIRSPVTGLEGTIQKAIDDLFNYNAQSITAQDYDNLELTASVYDDKNITALEYDMYANAILN